MMKFNDMEFAVYLLLFLLIMHFEHKIIYLIKSTHSHPKSIPFII